MRDDCFERDAIKTSGIFWRGHRIGQVICEGRQTLPLVRCKCDAGKYDVARMSNECDRIGTRAYNDAPALRMIAS